MPAATTHVLFAKDAYTHFSNTLQSKITNMPLFYLGSEGPDLFFFSHYVGLPNSLKKYGDFMHTHGVKEVISFLQQYVQKHSQLLSYYVGYLCHYSLDSYTHPLINQNAKLNHETYHLSSGLLHIHSEAEIDCHVLKRHHKTIDDYNVYDDIQINSSDAYLLASMYTQLFQEVFHISIKQKDILESIQGIHRLTKLLRPQNKWKYAFVTKLERLFHLPKFVSGMMLNQKNSETASVLNKDHLITFGNQCNLSFDELYDQALDQVEVFCSHPEQIHYDFLGQSLSSAEK